MLQPEFFFFKLFPFRSILFQEALKKKIEPNTQTECTTTFSKKLQKEKIKGHNYDPDIIVTTHVISRLKMGSMNIQ